MVNEFILRLCFIRLNIIEHRHKAPTTADPSYGISDAITAMFHGAKIDPKDIASVTIGTTVRQTLSGVS